MVQSIKGKILSNNLLMFVVITQKFVGHRYLACNLVIIHRRWILSTKQQINVSSLPHLWPSGDQDPGPTSGADDRRVVRVAPLHKLIIISLGITSQYYPSPDTNQKPPTLTIHIHSLFCSTVTLIVRHQLTQ